MQIDYQKKTIAQKIMFKITTTQNQNSLLNEVTITNKSLNIKSTIYPNLGASLQKLTKNSIEIIDGITNDEKGLELYKNKFNSSFLFPSPNRIDDGKYTFNNKTYQLACNETALNNSLHGHIFNKRFKIIKTEATEENAEITLSYSNNGDTIGFPFAYKIDITYTYTKNNLAISFNVVNNSEEEFPFGLGWHPYFKSTNLSKSILNFDGTKKYNLNEKMIPQNEIQIPFKTPLTIEDTFLDDCFLIEKNQTIFKTPDYEITLDFACTSNENYLQCYTPNTRDCIAIEPMTCAPNSFNNKSGLLTLMPKESFDWQINLKF